MSSFKEYKIDKLILITSQNFNHKAEEIKDKVGVFNINTVIILIDPFTKSSYSEIVNKIIEYTKKEDINSNFFVNITGGTNLMSSAALTAAQLLGTNVYYVLKGEEKDEFIEVPIVKISLEDSLTTKQKNIFGLIYREVKKSGKIKNLNKFAESHGSYKQIFRNYVKQFEKLNLIKIDRSEREHSLYLTETGKLIKKLI